MRRQSGFTLIELMIVIVVVGILVTVAVPLYQDSILKSRRAGGMAALMEISARQERFYAQHGTYTDVIHDPDEPESGLIYGSTTSPGGHYTLSAAKCGSGANQTLANCYILTAKPKKDSPQFDDTRCASLTLDSFSNRTATGTNSAECW